MRLLGPRSLRPKREGLDASKGPPTARAREPSPSGEGFGSAEFAEDDRSARENMVAGADSRAGGGGLGEVELGGLQLRGAISIVGDNDFASGATEMMLLVA